MQVIGDKVFEEVAEIGEWDYDWSIGKVLRDEAGDLFWGYDSGCSCTYFGENVGLDDLVPLKSLAEAVEWARKANEERFAGFSDDDIARLAEQLLF